MPTVEELVRRLFTITDEKQPHLHADVLCPDIEIISPSGRVSGVEAWAALFEQETDFHGARHVLQRVTGSGERAAIEGVWTATYLPKSNSIETTDRGTAVELAFCMVAECQDGRLSRLSVYQDQNTLQQQLPESSPAT